METNNMETTTIEVLETVIQAIKTDCPADLRDSHNNTIKETLAQLEQKLFEYVEKASNEEIERILDILEDQTETFKQAILQSLEDSDDSDDEEEDCKEMIDKLCNIISAVGIFETTRAKLVNIKKAKGIKLFEKKLKAATEKLNQI